MVGDHRSAGCRCCSSATPTATLRALPQRVPPPGLAAVRHRRHRRRLRDPLPVPRVAVPARRIIGQGERSRHARRLRRRRLRPQAGRGRRLAAHGLDQHRRSTRRVRPRAAGGRDRRSSRSSRSSWRLSESHLRAVQLEGAARELLGELPHPVRAPRDRHLVERGLPDGERRPRALRVGSAAASVATIATEQIRATLLPGEPGWEALAAPPTDRPYDVGSYLTIWPNAMINVFPDAALVMWIEPLDGDDDARRAPAAARRGPVARRRAGDRRVASARARAGRRHLRAGAALAHRRARRRRRARHDRGARRVLRARASPSVLSPCDAID